MLWTLSMVQLLARPTFGDTDMSAFYISFFFSGLSCCGTVTWARFQTTQNTYEEISVKCFSRRHNDVLLRTGIEP